MDSIVSTMVTIISVLIGSGLIQYFVDRKDKKISNSKDEKLDVLRKEFQKGLSDGEETGKSRYNEQKNALEKMAIAHQKDFQELKEAIMKLTENDTKITESIEKMSYKQELMADSLLGLSHDKIIATTDKISMRGAITIKEQATLESMYKPYSALGGNGHCRKAMEHVSTLAVISDEDARHRDKELQLQN